MRVALNDAAPLYRDAPEAREARASGDRTMQTFMVEALPEASEATRTLAAQLITTTLSKVGKHFSESPSKLRRDRNLRWRHGRHVLRLSRKPCGERVRSSILALEDVVR